LELVGMAFCDWLAVKFIIKGGKYYGTILQI
jgi:hypothetical protein